MASAAVRKNRYNNPRATYGSVAYDLDYSGGAIRKRQGEEALRERPMVRPRERAAVRPKVRVREAGHVSLFAVVGFLAVGVFSVLLILSYIQLTSLSDDIAGLKSQISTLETQETKLRTQYELAFDLSSIETKVTSNGSMVKPQSGQILYLDLSEPDSVVRFEKGEQPLAGVTGALAGVKKVFGNIVEYFR